MRSVRRIAAATLAKAGVESAERDADLLLAHVLGIGLGQLALVDTITSEQKRAYNAVVARRAKREPLQHITGSAAFRRVQLEVGPGVFVPRPETELLAEWAIVHAQRLLKPPVVVDLCTGSGAMARAIHDEVRVAKVHAVELDRGAYDWARRNLADTDVDLRLGDMATEFDDLIGTVDIVVCNPPYIPLEAWESVAVEARDHDPYLALFSGEDGLDAIRVLATRAAELLRPGGLVGVEHADVQGKAVPELFREVGLWEEVVDHVDLAGRPRFTTARLAR